MSDLNKVERLSTVSGGPFKIIREAAKAGLKGVRNLVFVFLFFAFCNLVFFVTAVFRVLSVHASFNTFVLLIAVAVMGLLFTCIAVYWAYKSILTEIIAVVYAGMGSTILNLCNALIEKASLVLPRNTEVGEGLVRSLDLARLVSDRLARSPRFVKSGILLALQRAPFAQQLSKAVPMLQVGHKEEAKQQLFNHVNQYVLEAILGRGRTWVYVLATLNFLLQLLLLHGIR